jgi:hypothetical protein
MAIAESAISRLLANGVRLVDVGPVPRRFVHVRDEACQVIDGEVGKCPRAPSFARGCAHLNGLGLGLARQCCIHSVEHFEERRAFAAARS